MKLPVLLLLTLLCITGMIEIQAQTPPMPPRLTVTNAWVEITNGMPHKKVRTFTVTCHHCGLTSHRLHPMDIHPAQTTMGNDGTNIVTCAVLLICPGCGETIVAKNVKRVPVPLAVEDSEPISGGAGGGGSAQTWTTDPNLFLTITRTNCTSDAPFHATEANTILIPPDTGLASSMICGPLVCVRFFTSTNLLYTCQASDDGTKTWLNGLPVIGNGGPVTLCEVPLHPHRIYRVLETPL